MVEGGQNNYQLAARERKKPLLLTNTLGGYDWWMEAKMRIGLTSVMVDDQEKALAFYTEKLGFIKKTDIPAGEYRWLTVVAPDGDDNVELVLEPLAFPPAKVYQEALFKAGIPATAFISDDVHAEFNKLKAQGVRFRGEPAHMGTATVVVFDDTCGNLISIVQPG